MTGGVGRCANHCRTRPARAKLDLDRAGITVAPVTRDVERCRTVDVGNYIVNGYDVTYRYRNRDFTIRMAYDPGDRVQVRVDVEPQAQ